MATWIFISERELGILGTWLDPKDYEPPSETALILLIAGTLAALVLTSSELRVAIRCSRKRLEEEEPAKAAIYGKALDLMEAYYLTFPHIVRSAIILGCATAILVLASYAKIHQSRTADAIAYII